MLATRARVNRTAETCASQRRHGVGLVGLLLLLGVSGCGQTTTVVKTVTTEAPEKRADAVSASSSEDAADAELGDLLTLAGDEATLKVRVTKIIDPLPVGEYDEADAGKRFVGVHFSVKNTGPQPYADALSNGTTLILRGDEQANSTIVSGGPCGGNFGSDVKIAAGDKRAGCVPFEVPAGKRLRSFQFTPNSGFADVTAEWDLRDAEPSSAPATPASAPQTPAAPAAPAGGTPSSAGGWTSCDANISARSPGTSCGFASNVFYEYWTAGQSPAIRAYSPASGSTYGLSCSSSGAQVQCTATDGAAVRFSQAAIDAYSQAQADSYAASHDVG